MKLDIFKTFLASVQTSASLWLAFQFRYVNKWNEFYQKWIFIILTNLRI